MTGQHHAGVDEVTAREAHDAVGQGALLVDVREPEEWRAGHAPQALHLPLGDVTRRVEELPRERRILMICRSGNRSGQAAELLSGTGLVVANVAGGMKDWAAEGLPVEAGDGRPGRVL